MNYSKLKHQALFENIEKKSVSTGSNNFFEIIDNELMLYLKKNELSKASDLIDLMHEVNELRGLALLECQINNAPMMDTILLLNLDKNKSVPEGIKIDAFKKVIAWNHISEVVEFLRELHSFNANSLSGNDLFEAILVWRKIKFDLFQKESNTNDFISSVDINKINGIDVVGSWINGLKYWYSARRSNTIEALTNYHAMYYMSKLIKNCAFYQKDERSPLVLERLKQYLPEKIFSEYAKSQLTRWALNSDIKKGDEFNPHEKDLGLIPSHISRRQEDLKAVQLNEISMFSKLLLKEQLILQENNHFGVNDDYDHLIISVDSDRRLASEFREINEKIKELSGNKSVAKGYILNKLVNRKIKQLVIWGKMPLTGLMNTNYSYAKRSYELSFNKNNVNEVLNKWLRFISEFEQLCEQLSQNKIQIHTAPEIQEALNKFGEPEGVVFKNTQERLDLINKKVDMHTQGKIYSALNVMQKNLLKIGYKFDIVNQWGEVPQQFHNVDSVSSWSDADKNLINFVSQLDTIDHSIENWYQREDLLIADVINSRLDGNELSKKLLNWSENRETIINSMQYLRRDFRLISPESFCIEHKKKIVDIESVFEKIKGDKNWEDLQYPAVNRLVEILSNYNTNQQKVSFDENIIEEIKSCWEQIVNNSEVLDCFAYQFLINKNKKIHKDLNTNVMVDYTNPLLNEYETFKENNKNISNFLVARTLKQSSTHDAYYYLLNDAKDNLRVLLNPKLNHDLDGGYKSSAWLHKIKINFLKVIEERLNIKTVQISAYMENISKAHLDFYQLLPKAFSEEKLDAIKITKLIHDNTNLVNKKDIRTQISMDDLLKLSEKAQEILLVAPQEYVIRNWQNAFDFLKNESAINKLPEADQYAVATSLLNLYVSVNYQWGEILNTLKIQEAQNCVSNEGINSFSLYKEDWLSEIQKSSCFYEEDYSGTVDKKIAKINQWQADNMPRIELTETQKEMLLKEPFIQACVIKDSFTLNEVSSMIDQFNESVGHCLVQLKSGVLQRKIKGLMPPLDGEWFSENEKKLMSHKTTDREELIDKAKHIFNKGFAIVCDYRDFGASEVLKMKNIAKLNSGSFVVEHCLDNAREASSWVNDQTEIINNRLSYMSLGEVLILMGFKTQERLLSKSFKSTQEALEHVSQLLNKEMINSELLKTQLAYCQLKGFSDYSKGLKKNEIKQKDQNEKKGFTL